MTKEQRQEIRGLAKSDKRSDLEAATMKWLGLEKEYAAEDAVPEGNAASVGAIVEELVQYAETDKAKTATAGKTK